MKVSLEGSAALNGTQPETRSMLRRFAEYYRPWKRLFWLDFCCAVLSGILELAFPLAVTAFIDKLLPQGDWGLTLLAAGGLLFIYMINAGLMAVVTYWGHMLGINIETVMRARAFEHLTRLSWRWYDRMRTGKLVARVTRDLEEIGEVAHHGPEDLFVAVMTFIGAFALMLSIHPGARRSDGIDRALNRLDRLAFRWSHDTGLARHFLPARTVQCPPGGGAGRHTPRSGLR